jgi:hypothetical protein
MRAASRLVSTLAGTSQNRRCLNNVRFLLPLIPLLLTACGPGLVFNMSPEMTRDQMLTRADHIFIGVIEKQEYENWLFLQIPGEKHGDWTILKRQVRIETLLRGQESHQSVIIYEFFGTRGAVGDWNSTREGERDLFMVRVENGRYHVVRDWWRSIFRIYSGRHNRLPLEDSHPFWERIGLLSWWIGEGATDTTISWWRRDPGHALSEWRAAKLARGFLRHPRREIRLLGCETLLQIGRWQDECGELLSPEDRAELTSPDHFPRPNEEHAMEEWNWAATANDVSWMRLLTTVNRPNLRSEFCRLFAQRFPNDHDNGCPADQPPPATIVTKDGDVPLVGAWPQMRE